MFYSDGFTEQVNPEGDMLEEEGLARIAGLQEGISGGDFIEALIWHLADYSGDAEFDDDVSGRGLLRYRGSANS